MRSVRTGVWLAAFVMGASVPAFCQIVIPPNGSGRTIEAGVVSIPFQQGVHSTGPFDFTLAVLKNAQLRYVASGIVCTSGPSTSVTFNVPVGQFGLSAGDYVTFIWKVRHRVSEGGTTSIITAMIPVVAPSGGGDIPVPPPTGPPPTTTRLTPPQAGPGEIAARREETA